MTYVLKINDLITTCHNHCGDHLYMVVATTTTTWGGNHLIACQNMMFGYEHAPIWYYTEDATLVPEDLATLVLYGPHQGRRERYSHMIENYKHLISKEHIIQTFGEVYTI